ASCRHGGRYRPAARHRRRPGARIHARFTCDASRRIILRGSVARGPPRSGQEGYAMARRIRQCVVALSFVLASAAHASTVYVANNGTDDASCGSKASPCRSITRGIHVASAGDHVVVGPGSYRGESGAPGCDCFVAVGKPLALTSSDGAASTVIDARGFLVRTN